MLLNEYRSYETFVSCLILIPVCVDGQGVMIGSVSPSDPVSPHPRFHESKKMRMKDVLL